MILDIYWGVEPIIFIQRFFGESWSWFFKTVTELGDVEGVALVFAMVFWIYGRRLAWCLIGAVVFVISVNLLIGSIIDVPRPNHPEIKVYRELNLSSFPSGHTGTATIFWGMLTTLTHVPLVITVLVVVLVMLSRLYLGVHYLGDVIGGLIIGLILLKIYPMLWDIVLRWFNGRTFKLFLILSLLVPISFFPFADSFPKGWEVFGASVGAAIGIPLELWYVHYSPTNISKQKQIFKVIIGLSVLIIIVFNSHFLSNYESVGDAIGFALGSFWILFLAPMLFKHLGFSIS
ncbi:putative membrane-associated phospholipid phosphatase [Calothrix sp. NIES-4071]|nr:putative membrane-associated phospholipid phosphatase [Calothrix sp. NIES-4071]BAZ55222.1 putative membrane-associated phospholipid phosphatase [Calothrix sp. NIES-4105]